MTSESLDRGLIVRIARSWAGTPYLHLQSSKGVATDCLGLLRGVWRELYGEEPELPPVYSSSWRDGSGAEQLLDAARRHLVPVETEQPGDVLIFRWRPNLPARHCGILVSADRMVHAYEAAGVATESDIGPWRKDSRIAGRFAFPGVV